MLNLSDTIFRMKTNVLKDFHIRIRVPLNNRNLLRHTNFKIYEFPYSRLM